MKVKMAKSYKPTEYMYSSARLRSLESKILGREEIFRFADADGAENILPSLTEHGFELVRNSLGEILREDTLMSALEHGFDEVIDMNEVTGGMRDTVVPDGREAE